MLHVPPQPEPADFDVNVRQKGLAYLDKQGFALDQPLPPKAKIEAYWTSCLDDLFDQYSSTCAYLAVHIERITATGSVDHFAPKSQLPAQAYEWSNYRLVCSRMNSRKREFQDVLDPFLIENGYFQLELVSGRIFPNPDLGAATRKRVIDTIARLGLDDAGCRSLRAEHFGYYLSEDITASFLKKMSPFVWYEANRQGLLCR
ncbi:hypothetical protein [Oceanobacter sp. 3_MG-2023]|uniref:hypothetical protein n=1 Tax=Oceanobacter sp. 3_MG-2023 TaxID=3062622 RepID=UPI002735DC22|nr:hypothetical protein [Oceanobacter sp. 3_MG-2023]MDP2504948.1 hypothetical protein [Oceanobacter sp. 3_MG-2023]